MEDFKTFFTSLLKDVEFQKTDDCLTANWHGARVSLKITDSEHRYLDLLPTFHIAFGYRTYKVSAFNSDHAPGFDKNIYYRINNHEHMLRCRIEKEIALQVWLILICDKSLSELRIGFGQVYLYNPIDHGYIFPKLSDLLSSWYNTS